MARFAFDPSKWSRWFLPFPRPIPPVVSGAFDDPKTCVGINQRWAVKLISAIDTLSDRRTWDNTTDSEFAFIEQQVGLIQAHLLKVTGCADDCPDCPEPEPCPECPEPEPVPTDQPVGNFGFTIDELENMIMGCINISGMLKFENGFLYVKDDCCNWVKVTGQAAPVLTTQTPAGNAASTFDLWQDQGFPALPEQPAVQHSNSAYTTLDSLRCAKATALTEALWNYLNSDREILEDAKAGDSITTLIATITGYFAIISPAELLDFATTTRTAAFGMDMVDYSAELLAILDDEIIKSEIICVLTDRVAAPINLGGWTMNRVTDSDIQATIQTFKDVAGAGEEIEARVNAVLLKQLAWETTQKLDTIECGCEDKLPHGYTPPTDGLVMRFERLAYTGNLGYGNAPSWLGQPYEGAYASGQTGTMVDGLPKTVFTGYEGSYTNTMFAAIFKLSDVAEVSSIKALFAFEPTPTEVRLFTYYYNTGTAQWVTYAADVIDNSAPYATELAATDLTPPICQYLAIVLKARVLTSGNVPRYARLTDLQIAGLYGGNGFIDLSVGEVFNP